MTALSVSRATSTWRFRWTCLAVIAVLGGFVLLLAGDLSVSARLRISDIGLVGGGLFALACCGHRSLRSTGRRRVAWRFLAAGGAVGALVNLWVLAVRVTGLPESAASVGDAGFVLALLLGIGGMVTFPSVRRRGSELTRMILDGVVVGGSVLYLVSITIFPQMLESRQGPLVARAVVLLLPLVDVLLATLAVLLFLRASAADRPALALVSGGFALYALSDLAFAALSVQTPYSFGSPIDVGWIAGYALIGLAARHPAASGSYDVAEHAEPSPLAGTILMFALFFTAAVLSLVRSDVMNVPLGAMWLLVLVALVARQVVLILDNEALRAGLEQRVHERTSELRRLTRQSELLLSSVGDGIYGVDREGRVTFVNPAAADTLGYQPEDLIGKEAHATFHSEQTDGTPFPTESCYVSEAITQGITANAEEDLYKRKNGRTVPVEVTASPVANDENVLGAVVVFRDVTQRREVDRLKSEFVSMVSHELRTPLTSIRGSLGLLAGGALGELPQPATRMVGIALDSSERLTRLINDILDIERIESGTMPLDLGNHPAGELIGAAVAQVQVLAEAAGVSVQVTSAQGTVEADADRVVQTLINLLGNAIKFSGADTAVEVEAVDDGHLVEFRVTDRGRGVPKDKLDSIFGRFEQVDSSDAREKGGSGLGLAISRSIVERHGGRIWAESHPGDSTTFRFTLPRAVGMAHRPTAENAGPTVVVCDDDENVVATMCALLERRGYRAVGVTNGQEAIARVTAERPAAVLLGVSMPGTGGAQVVAALRSRQETQDIPIILISGLSPSGNKKLAAQTDGWLVKPIDETRLARTIAVAIAGHPSRGSVLMVEDDEDLASVIRTLLERDGLAVRHARTATEALALCRSSQPQVLILDLHLPDGDGVDVVTQLRQEGQLAQIPLVVYSAVDVADGAKDELRLGRTVFLTKGRVSPQELEDRVLELVDQATGRQRCSEDPEPAQVG